MLLVFLFVFLSLYVACCFLLLFVVMVSFFFFFFFFFSANADSHTFPIHCSPDLSFSYIIASKSVSHVFLSLGVFDFVCCVIVVTFVYFMFYFLS